MTFGRNHALLAAFVAATCPLVASVSVGATKAELRLATWNMEWLMAPETALTLRQRCLHGERRLPCDVVQDRPRSGADLAVLARYASALNADVIALQEVDGAGAAARVFQGYRFCFTQRGDLQNVGFAIRPDIAFRCEPDVQSISLGDRVRRGAVVTLYPGEPREMHLLAVHLKSGCSVEPLRGGARNCRLLADQAPAVARWIASQVAARHAYALLGDFNRDLRAEAETDSGVWAALAAAGAAEAPLVDVGAGTPFRACHAGQPFTRYIDYILLGGGLSSRVRTGSFQRLVYDDRDAHHFKLSDHCPLSVSVRLR